MRESSSVPPLAARVALWLAIGVLASATTAHAFDLHRHALMTRQVLERQGMPRVAASIVAFAAMLPDIQGCVQHCYCDYAPTFCQPDSAQAIPFAAEHFDNNLLDETIYLLNDRMGIAQAGVNSTPTDYRAAGRSMVAFGRALHTTQDFYAHSTFLEINLFLLRGNPMNLPLWQGQPYAGFPWTTSDGLTGGGGIETGYYLQGGPFGSYTHDLLNKDNAGSSVHGRVPRGISTPINTTTTLYGLASGDFTNSMTFDAAGLAPRHTVFALNVLINGGLVFPFVFSSRPTSPVSPAGAQQAQAFFDWVSTNPDLIAIAEAADSLIAHANSDSIGSFPMSAVDADGLPLPLTTGAPVVADGEAWLSAPEPNPFTSTTTIRCVAPRAGSLRVAVHDLEGRRLAVIADAPVAAGRHTFVWNGRDDAGHEAPPGVYLVRVSGFGRDEARRVARVR